eukprot:scaffold2228_cov30-Phaeocystis_antarctica.AAC.1
MPAPDSPESSALLTLVPRTGAVGTEHASSGTSCGSLTLEVGKNRRPLHDGELSCPLCSGRRFSSSLRRRAVRGTALLSIDMRGCSRARAALRLLRPRP